MEIVRKTKVVPMQIGRILLSKIDNDMAKKKAIAAEPTGKGDLLIIDGFFGRMFRSDEGCVRDELDEYCRQYNEICRRLEEDPAHEYYEVLNYNDLYGLHGIIPSVAGNLYGYTNSEDYSVDLKFDIQYITEGEWVDMFGEPYLYYQPYEWCYPDPCYMEV